MALTCSRTPRLSNIKEDGSIILSANLPLKSCTCNSSSSSETIISASLSHTFRSPQDVMVCRGCGDDSVMALCRKYHTSSRLQQCPCKSAQRRLNDIGELQRHFVILCAWTHKKPNNDVCFTPDRYAHVHSLQATLNRVAKAGRPLNQN